jgi:hypothetical protein
VFAVGCGGGGGFPDAAIDSPPPGPGSFSLAWTVTDSNGAPIDCSKIGGATVTATLRNLSAVGGQTEVFTCMTGMGMSQKDITPGTYEISLELDSTTNTILQTVATQHAVVINSDSVTALTPVVFAVNAVGGLKLHLATNKAGGNCGAAPDGGAIDAMTISVNHETTGPCEPISFTIGAGATTSATMYTINCTTPATAPCIEADQEIDATMVPSDKYTFHITGSTAGANCWSNNDMITVPPLGGTLTTTLNLGHAPVGTPGC